MIPVTPQPQPAKFDEKVRQPGLAWLKKNNINLTVPLPSNTNPHPYWRECLDDLHKSYKGICAYLAVYIERATGAVTTDHFVAKSSHSGLIYEWSNYRLACMVMNARKRAFDDVLDPFTLPADMFQLELASGRIFVNPEITGNFVCDAKLTIERLKLDSSVNRDIRARHFEDYARNNINSDHLRKTSPFVWYEAQRQGLL